MPDHTITCPVCNHVHHVFGGAGGDPMPEMDDMMDDSDSTEVQCRACETVLEVDTHIVFTFTAEVME